MYKTTRNLLLLGIASGILAGVSAKIFWIFLPGVFMGALLGIYFHFYEKVSWKKVLLLSFISGLAYFVALSAMGFGLGLPPAWFLAGALGSFILAKTFFIITKIKPEQLGFISLMGGIGGVLTMTVFQYMPASLSPPYTAGLTPLACVLIVLPWHVFFSASVGFVLDRIAKQKMVIISN